MFGGPAQWRHCPGTGEGVLYSDVIVQGLGRGSCTVTSLSRNWGGGSCIVERLGSWGLGGPKWTCLNRSIKWSHGELSVGGHNWSKNAFQWGMCYPLQWLPQDVNISIPYPTSSIPLSPSLGDYTPLPLWDHTPLYDHTPSGTISPGRNMGTDRKLHHTFPVDRMTDMGKNITFPQLRWRAVNITFATPLTVFNELILSIICLRLLSGAQIKRTFKQDF